MQDPIVNFLRQAVEESCSLEDAFGNLQALAAMP